MCAQSEDEWGRPPDIIAAYLVEREAQTEVDCTSLIAFFAQGTVFQGAKSIRRADPD